MDRPPIDPADHARDFSLRYADDLEIATGQVMIDLDLEADRMGARDPARNLEHHTFYPSKGDCGGINHLGQINVDSGVMNPAVMDGPYGEACGALWRRLRLRDRMEAIIAHELAESENGGDHEQALRLAPDTRLPISPAARGLLRAQRVGSQDRTDSGSR